MRPLFGLICVLVLGCATRGQGPLQTLPETQWSDVQEWGTPGYQRAKAATPEAQVLAQRVLAKVPEAERGSVRWEPALDRVAATVAEVTGGEERPLAEHVVEELVWHSGTVGELAGVWTATVEGGGGEDFLDENLKVPWPPGQRYAFGIARVSSGMGSRTAQALVVCLQPVELEPFAKQLAAGASLELKGRLSRPLSDPVFFVDDGHAVLKRDLLAGPNGEFTVSLPSPSAPGRHLVELTQLDELGWRVSLAAFPIWVAAAPPAVPSMKLLSDTPNPPLFTDWEKYVRDQLNAQRAAASLAPLQPHPKAQQVAVSEAANRVKNPKAPPTPNLSAQLNRQGLRTRAVWQYAGSVVNLADEMLRTLARPSMRELVLDPAVDRLGVAFQQAPGGAVMTSWIAAGELNGFDGAALAQQLRDEIDRRRAKKGNPKTRTEPELDQLAAEAAAVVCAGKEPRAALEAGAAKLKKARVEMYYVAHAPVLWPGALRYETDEKSERFFSRSPLMGIGVCEKGQPGGDDNENAVLLFAAPNAR